MKIENILEKCDHTLLDRRASLEEIKTTLDDAIAYGCASACIPPYFVKAAKEYVGDRLKICTVIGFPNGYSTTETKLFEAREAISNGADEIDTVVNLSMVRDRLWEEIKQEITLLKEVCGKRVLKVIVETCLLSEEEKVMLCELLPDCGADFIKTSTGFSTKGATPEDVKLFKKHASRGMKIKAAGGISSLQDAEEMILSGADRLGTSKIVKLAKNMTPDGAY